MVTLQALQGRLFCSKNTGTVGPPKPLGAPCAGHCVLSRLYGGSRVRMLVWCFASRTFAGSSTGWFKAAFRCVQDLCTPRRPCWRLVPGWLVPLSMVSFFFTWQEYGGQGGEADQRLSGWPAWAELDHQIKKYLTVTRIPAEHATCWTVERKAGHTLCPESPSSSLPLRLPIPA